MTAHVAGSMLFLFLVSLVGALAALLADTGLRRGGLASRFVWLGALALGPLLLAWSALGDRAGAAAAEAAHLGPIAVVELPGIVVGADAGRGWLLGGWVVLALWALSGVAFALMLERARASLARDGRAWRPRRVFDQDVLLSDALGPAVTGVLRPRIVLPRWTLSLPERQLRLVLLHEASHVRAGDSRLLALAVGLVGLTPWNPVAWWLLRRLRLAVEIDCDRRVLRAAPDRVSYGESLIAVAARSSGPTLGLAAFTERFPSLERRIVAMTAGTTHRSRLTGTLLVAAGVLVGVQACGVDGPLGAEPGRDGALAQEVPTALATEPTFTPFTVAPEITNRDQVIDAMGREYPPLLREAGIGGAARVYFLIGADGIVHETLIDRSTGHEALDQAALRVAGVYRFTPALDRDERVPVWVSFPITFQP